MLQLRGAAVTRIRPGGQDSQFGLPGTLDRPVGHSVQLGCTLDTELPNCPVGHNEQSEGELKGFVKKEPASQHAAAMRPLASQARLSIVIFSDHLLPHTVLLKPLLVRMDSMLTTLDTSHFEMSELNALAPSNVLIMCDTLDTSHFETSELNASAF